MCCCQLRLQGCWAELTTTVNIFCCSDRLQDAFWRPENKLRLSGEPWSLVNPYGCVCVKSVCVYITIWERIKLAITIARSHPIIIKIWPTMHTSENRNRKDCKNKRGVPYYINSLPFCHGHALLGISHESAKTVAIETERLLFPTGICLWIKGQTVEFAFLGWCNFVTMYIAILTIMLLTK